MQATSKEASVAAAPDAETLTRDRAYAVAGPARQIILTFVNRVRVDFARTWVHHVRRLGLTNWLVGATDAGALETLRADAIPRFSMRTNLPESEWDWGSPTFKALGMHKVALILTTLSWGLELVITDVDALVLREPFAYMNRWRGVGILTTTDHLGNGQLATLTVTVTLTLTRCGLPHDDRPPRQLERLRRRRPRGPHHLT